MQTFWSNLRVSETNPVGTMDVLMGCPWPMVHTGSGGHFIGGSLRESGTQEFRRLCEGVWMGFW